MMLKLPGCCHAVGHQISQVAFTGVTLRQPVFDVLMLVDESMVLVNARVLVWEGWWWFGSCLVLVNPTISVMIARWCAPTWFWWIPQFWCREPTQFCMDPTFSPPREAGLTHFTQICMCAMLLVGWLVQWTRLLPEDWNYPQWTRIYTIRTSLLPGDWSCPEELVQQTWLGSPAHLKSYLKITWN